MSEPKKEDSLRATEVADLDPYNVRGKPAQNVAKELLGEEIQELQEKEIEGSTFTPEQRQKLEQEGYDIYTLTGKTLQELSDTGLIGFNLIGFNAVASLRDIYNTEGSLVGDVAIMSIPQLLFIENSKYKTYLEQKEEVEQYGAALAKRIPGVFATMGNLQDYIELASLNNEIFGPRSNERLARTTTAVNPRDVAVIGRHVNEKVSILQVSPLSKLPTVYALPIVIPNND